MNISVKKERKIIAIVAIIGSFLLALTIISCYFLSRYLTAQHGDIVVLYTNDIHGYFDKKLSYASVASIKQDLINQGKKVIVMDAGDHLSGSLYSIYDKGQTVMELMDEAGYDVATLGNHEFDHGFKRLDEVRHNAKYEYICSNLYHLENNKITTRYTDNGSKIFNIANRKIGVVGVATPNTISTSSPTHFQDEHGNYIYTFLDGNNGFDLYDNVQREVNSLKSRGCDYVIALTHLGNYDGIGNPMYTSDYLAKNTTGINIVIDGHSHHFIQGKYLKNKAGGEVIILQTGEYFEHIGKLMLSSNGTLTNEFFSTYPRANEMIIKKQRDFMHEVDEKYNAKIAHSDITFTRPDIANNNFGDFCADAFYYRSLTYPDSKNNPVNITFVNQGGIRVKKVEKGDWKLRTCRDIFTFDNTFIVRRMKGRLIKLALEWGARDMPGYCGAFLPCAG